MSGEHSRISCGRGSRVGWLRWRKGGRGCCRVYIRRSWRCFRNRKEASVSIGKHSRLSLSSSRRSTNSVRNRRTSLFRVSALSSWKICCIHQQKMWHMRSFLAWSRSTRQARRLKRHWMVAALLRKWKIKEINQSHAKEYWPTSSSGWPWQTSSRCWTK